jgi:hypothetical protein
VSDANTLGRREFLAQASAAGAAGMVGVTAMAKSAQAIGPFGVPLDRVESSHFEPTVGTRFRVHREDEAPLDVSLVKCDKYGYRGAWPAHLKKREPFSLIFSAPKDTQLEGGTYTVSHRELGTFQLSLMPVDQPKRRAKLQAILS